MIAILQLWFEEKNMVLVSPHEYASPADHQAFLQEAEQRELAIGDMEKRLDAAKESLKEKPENDVDKAS